MKVSIQNDGDKDRHRKRAFALLEQHKVYLEYGGICSETFWDYLKHVFKVRSRKDFTEAQWKSIADRLQEAEHDTTILDGVIIRANDWIMSLENAPAPPQDPEDAPHQDPEANVGLDRREVTPDPQVDLLSGEDDQKKVDFSIAPSFSDVANVIRESGRMTEIWKEIQRMAPSRGKKEMETAFFIAENFDATLSFEQED